MVSPNVKRWAPWAVVAGGILTVPLGAWAFGAYLLDGANDLDEALNQRPTMATSPFIRQSPTPTPTPPMQTPTYNVTTPSFEEMPTTPVATPTESTSPTPSPTRTSSRPSPTNRPTTTSNVTVVRYHYDSTGTHSGLAYIDTATNGETQSTEYGVNCTKAVETGAVVMKITSYTYKSASDTDGELAFHQDPTPYPSLTAALCEGTQVSQSFAGNPGKYASILSPFANIS